MSNRNLYDGATGVGTHAIPFVHGPILGWVDPETRGKLYKATFRVRAEFFPNQYIGSAGPLGGWLIDPGQPSHIGCGLLEWEQTYAFLPPSRPGGETVSYLVQQISGGEIVELAFATSAVISYDYFRTVDPTTIPTLRAVRYVKVNDAIRIVGTPSANTGNGYVLAEDSRIREWRPQIYERSAAYVRPVTLLAT